MNTGKTNSSEKHLDQSRLDVQQDKYGTDYNPRLVTSRTHNNN